MKWIIFILLTSIVVIVLTILFPPGATIHSKLKKTTSQNLPMTITSSVFENNGQIPAKYTCDGESINPPLLFSDVPKDAKSLVLLVDDPDAPSGTWHHWSVYNIDPIEKGIEESKKSVTGVEGITSSGKVGYSGPCPPPASSEQLQRGETGTHHYHFKLYALDTRLDLPQHATYNELQSSLENHIVEQAELIGLYSRSK